METVYDVTVVVVGMSNGVKVMASLVAWPWKLYLPWVVPKVLRCAVLLAHVRRARVSSLRTLVSKLVRLVL